MDQLWAANIAPSEGRGAKLHTPNSGKCNHKTTFSQQNYVVIEPVGQRSANKTVL